MPAMYCRPIVDCRIDAGQAPQLVGRLVGIDGRERAPHGPGERLGIAARPQRERQVLRRRLHERTVEGRRVAAQHPLVDHVARDAHDGEPRGVELAVQHPEALADRVLPRPEALGDRAADDGHRARPSAVSASSRPRPESERQLQRREERGRRRRAPPPAAARCPCASGCPSTSIGRVEKPLRPGSELVTATLSTPGSSREARAATLAHERRAASRARSSGRPTR